MKSKFLEELEILTPQLPPLTEAVISRKVDHGVEEVDYQGEDGIYKGTFCFHDKTVAVKELTIPKGVTTARHGHEGAEHCLVYSGTFRVEHNGSVKVYKKGDCFEVPSNEEHVGTALTETKCIVMLINGEDEGYPQDHHLENE